MARCQMIDVLRRGQRFHQALAEYCRRARHHTKRAALREALSVVGRHEAWLAHCIAIYADDVPPKVANAWFRSTPDDGFVELLARAEITEDMEPDETIALALAFDECLARLFSRLADVAVTTELRESLLGLLDMERAAEKKLIHQLEQV